MLPLLLSTLLPLAHADTCDPVALDKALASSSPAQAAEAYLALVSCDETRGKKATPAALRRIVSDDKRAPLAIATALRLGADADVRTWIGQQTPDGRSRTLAGLGDQCDATPAVATFFVKMHADLGDQFFEDRWHRGLDACHDPAVRTMLTDALSSPVHGRGTRNRTLFTSILTVWARNLGGEAMPRLAEYLTGAKGDEEATLMLDAFSSAAHVGDPNLPIDKETAKAAVATIVAAAPNLGPRTLDRARGVLVSLEDQSASDGLAIHRFRDVASGGLLTYGVSAVEDVTCRNGDKRVALHRGSVTQDGSRWPDQLATDVQAKIEGAWTFDAAAKCKGTSTVKVTLSPEPLAADALTAWLDAQAAEAKPVVEQAKKAWTVSHDVTAW